jgi:SAM-dependent methyltransferase
VSNYFAYETAAQRYNKGRPYFHPLVIEKIAEIFPRGRVARALDVACGTGQSTQALSKIAGLVVGSDVSTEMLSIAPRISNVAYAVASAEKLPFGAGAFDLLTVALAFHWFRREDFLKEASRVLKPGGWLVVYNNWWTGRMKENPAFEEWTKGAYISRYPSPARDSRPPAEGAELFGFQAAGRERFSNESEYSLKQVVDYLVTQTNIIAAVERGEESLASVREWLAREVRPLFPEEAATFEFGGTIDYLRKST